MKALILICFLLVNNENNSFDYSTQNINKELTKNAKVIIRQDDTKVHIESIDKMVVTHEYVKTIIKQKSNKIYLPFDHSPSTKIKSLNAQVIDKDGREIKRIKKKDFEDMSAISGGTLHSDARMLVYSYTPTSYPVTISYQITTEYKNTAFIPSWMPIEDFHTAVEKSSYQLTYGNNIKVKIKEYNTDSEISIESNKIKSGIIYKANDIPAIKKEYLSPTWDEICPKVSYALNTFKLEGSIARNDNWNQFGKWMHHSILKKQNNLSDKVKNEIKQHTAHLESDEAKARAVHQYVQDRSRYISVQLGIGGWKPIDAQSVHNSGYGDCKGLTNYTKALLDFVEVDAHYTIIYAGADKKNMDAELSKVSGTHVILCLPDLIGSDTTWLECTSSSTPFGFIGGFTDDRNALIITPDGGEIKKTRSYTYRENININNHQIDIDIYGDAVIHSTSNKQGLFYSDIYQLEEYELDPAEYYRNKWNLLSNLNLVSSDYNKIQKEVQFNEYIKVVTEQYGYIAGKEMIIVAHQLDGKLKNIPRSRNRKLEMKINEGFTQIDTSTIQLPEGTQLTLQPEDVTIDKSFGNYNLRFHKIDNREIIVTRSLIIKEGSYPASEYDGYRDFIKKVNSHDKSKLIINPKA